MSEPTVFLGAFLLFLLQPLAAARVLPAFGGGPVVWTASLLVFQALLLAGYALALRIAPSTWRRALPWAVAAALAGLALVPSPGALAGADWAVPRLLGALLSQAGLPFLLLATTTPLVTAAVAATSTTPSPASRPLHRLYAASNLGSAAGLLAGPLLFDPFLDRAQQRVAVGLLLLFWAVGIRRALPAVEHTAPGPTPGEPTSSGRLPSGERTASGPEPADARSTWWLFSALGTALLSTVTAALSQDLSVVPLLWVVPLLLYLATFVLAFGLRRLPGREATTAAVTLAAATLALLLRYDWRLAWYVQLGGLLAVLFVGCFAAHVELVRRRPPDAGLGRFYLALAAGGALGTAVVGLLAPLVLPVPLELPLVVLGLFIAAARTLVSDRAARFPLMPTAGLVGLLVLVSVGVAAGFGHFAWRRVRGGATWERSVFGALQVKQYGDAGTRTEIRHLLDGRISHGFQYLHPERRHEPTAYFAPASGIGRCLTRPRPPRSVAIMGLGIGTLAAYGRPGDRYRFYELNPAAIEVAHRDFTFLADSPATVEVVAGDARVLLAAETNTSYDLIAVDAFSGDAIPVHLITEEAIDLALSHLSSDGLLAVNISNRHADLARVLRAHAERLGLAAGYFQATVRSPLDAYRSDWAFLAFTPEAVSCAPEPLPPGAPIRFTDQYAPLLAILRSAP